MTIELVRQGNYSKAMKRISSSRLAPFTEQTHRKLTDLHPPGKGIITSIPTAEHVDIEAPSIGPWIKWCYSQPSKLRFNAAKSLTSSAGVQLEDPLGPFLFALETQPIIRKVDSVTDIGFNKWYLDDGIIGGEPKAVAITLNMIANELEKIGLSMNWQKNRINRACRVASGRPCGLPAIALLCFRSTNSIPNEKCRSSKHRTFL
ncbi:hypothetical protein GJ496_005465 [Pomphorhynchus laevis]|nr:hypothetical protein GJ496_005465 [Pomphorhynchus laevis]